MNYKTGNNLKPGQVDYSSDLCLGIDIGPSNLIATLVFYLFNKPVTQAELFKLSENKIRIRHVCVHAVKFQSYAMCNKIIMLFSHVGNFRWISR